MKGNLSFAGVHDVRDSLKRLEIGSSLSIHELLSISSLLTCANSAKAYGRHAENTELPDDSLDGMFRALEPLTPINSEISAASCISSLRSYSEPASEDANCGLGFAYHYWAENVVKIYVEEEE